MVITIPSSNVAGKCPLEKWRFQWENHLSRWWYVISKLAWYLIDTWISSPISCPLFFCRFHEWQHKWTVGTVGYFIEIGILFVGNGLKPPQLSQCSMYGMCIQAPPTNPPKPATYDPLMFNDFRIFSYMFTNLLILIYYSKHDSPSILTMFLLRSTFFLNCNILVTPYFFGAPWHHDFGLLKPKGGLDC